MHINAYNAIGKNNKRERKRESEREGEVRYLYIYPSNILLNQSNFH